MKLMTKETYVNATKGYIFGNTDRPIEQYAESVGELFRDLQQEFGRCVGKMYRDQPDGGAIQVGWVFEKRMTYEDSRRPYSENDFYTREVWVEVFSEYEREVTVTAAHPFGKAA